jgi:hypothetical protein
MSIALNTNSPSLKTVLSAARKLTAEEKQLLRLQLFSSDALNELKEFESRLKKKKAAIKKSDDEIVALTSSIRQKRYAHSKKMLH